MKFNPISIYFHWPFCESKCPYCDFNSHVRKNIDQKEWLRAFLNNIDLWKPYLNHSIITSIYFGGGTPSLMEPNFITMILESIHKNFLVSDKVEISLEANPSSVERDKFKDFSSSGINRISIGVQSFNNIDLKYLGRNHTSNEALAAIEIATSEFDNVNFDLIYGRQFQKISDWEKELKFAVSLKSQHLSLYQLTIEKDTTFGKLFYNGKLRGLPNQDLSREFFLLTNKICHANNLNSYEISNFSNKKFQCIHNLNYWKCGDFISIGPGAHGRFISNGDRYSYNNIKNPEKWLENAINKKNTIYSQKKLSKLEQFEEFFIMGIRLNEGLDLSNIEKNFCVKLDSEKLNNLKELKYVTIKENKLKVLLKGKLVLNSIIKELLV